MFKSQNETKEVIGKVKSAFESPYRRDIGNTLQNSSKRSHGGLFTAANSDKPLDYNLRRLKKSKLVESESGCDENRIVMQQQVAAPGVDACGSTPSVDLSEVALLRNISGSVFCERSLSKSCSNIRESDIAIKGINLDRYFASAEMWKSASSVGRSDQFMDSWNI